MTRKMKDSGIEWIKEIPIEWKVCRGKNVLDLLKRPTEDNYGVITCFRDGEVTLRSNRREQGFTFSDKEIGYQGIKSGDLVIHGMDGFAGAIGIADSDGKGSPVLNVCKPKDKYNVYFIQYYLRMLASQDVFLALATGIRERSCDLRWSKIANLLFPIPPIEEQSLIANYLDNKCNKIDKTIEKQKQVIEKLKEYKQSIITEAVTKGLNPDVKMKDSGIEWIGKMPEHWKYRKLKTISKVISKGTTPSTIGKDILDNGEIRFIKAENIRDNKVVSEPKFFIDKETNQILGRSKLVENDILFVIAGATIGKVAILSKELVPANTNQAISFIRLFNDENNKFIWYYLQSNYVKEKINTLSVQSAQPNLSMMDLGNFMFTYPLVEEQKEIADYLDRKCTAIDKSISQKEKLIEKLTEYKKSLIYECVTGKREV